jgi:hypothetical protein
MGPNAGDTRMLSDARVEGGKELRLVVAVACDSHRGSHRGGGNERQSGRST